MLDKDLLFRGNKKYSAETCCLISHRTNCFILDGASWRGKYKIGVTLQQGARCRNPFTGKGETIGYFKDELTAHLAWKNRKLYFAKLLVNEINDDRVKLALIDRYEGDYYA